MIAPLLAGLLSLGTTTVATDSPDAKANQDFVARASIGNLAAIAESELALERGTGAAVKAAARRLIDEHRAAERELEAAAAASGTPLPVALDDAHEARLAALKARSAPDFDASFVAEQAENHSNALTLYADYMLLGDDAGLKALATRMIPVAQSEFTAIRALSEP